MRATYNNTIVSELLPSFRMTYKDISVTRPFITENFRKRRLLPWECRARDATYSGQILADIEISFDHPEFGFVTSVPKIAIGKLPVMVGSMICWLGPGGDTKVEDMKECTMDPNGYFIIRGVEKVLLMQEQLCRNKILVEKDKEGLMSASCASATLETKAKVAVVLKGDCLYLKSSSFREKVPLFIVFKAMGGGSDRQAARLVSPGAISDNKRSLARLESILALSFEPLLKERIITEEDAMSYMMGKIRAPIRPEIGRSAAKQRAELLRILGGTLLPHVGGEGRLCEKLQFLALMARKAIYAELVASNDPSSPAFSNRDFLGNKRVECAGEMLGLIFEDLIKRFNAEVRKEADRSLSRWKKPDRSRIDSWRSELPMLASGWFGSELITHGLSHAVSSGNWSIKRFRVDRQGVTQPLARMNHLGALGMLTRMESHVEKTRKIAGPRSLQPSQMGFVCPVDTPDGESCGLVKHLALLAKVSVATDDAPVLALLRRLGVTASVSNGNGWAVLLNGKLVGATHQPQKLVTAFREARLAGQVEPTASVCADAAESLVDCWTDAGRLLRPLINLSRLPPLLEAIESDLPTLRADAEALLTTGAVAADASLDAARTRFDSLRRRLLAGGAVEYLDVSELDTCRLAFSIKEAGPDTTHIELCPSAILGLVASSVPFCNHNQSPRNTYQCAMGKQALGVPALSAPLRTDNVWLQLAHPQRPLVDSPALRLAGFHRLPAGHNATLAVLALSGYDVEDAVVLNQASVQRGLGRVIVTKKFLVELDDEGKGEALMPAPGCPDGLASPGQQLRRDAPLAMKVARAETPVGGDRQEQARGANNSDATTVVRPLRYPGSSGVVRDVFLSHSAEKSLVAKLMVSQVRVPEVGDKFSSRHGQKGVVGLILPQRDMPFSESGIVPDIVMNPHGFPSRMTVGKLLELLTGKAAALDGRIASAPAFEDKKPCVCGAPATALSGGCACRSPAAAAGAALRAHGFDYFGSEVFYSGTTGEPLRGLVFTGPVFYQRLKHMVADKIHARAAGRKTFLTRQPLEGRAKEGGLRLGEMERDCLLGYGASEILLERFLFASDEYYFQLCSACGTIGCRGTCRNDRSSEMKTIRLPYPAKLLMQELISMGIRPKINV